MTLNIKMIYGGTLLTFIWVSMRRYRRIFVFAVQMRPILLRNSNFKLSFSKPFHSFLTKNCTKKNHFTFLKLNPVSRIISSPLRQFVSPWSFHDFNTMDIKSNNFNILVYINKCAFSSKMYYWRGSAKKLFDLKCRLSVKL